MSELKRYKSAAFYPKGRMLSLPGEAEVKASIRASGTVVPHEMGGGIPTTKKRASEDSLYTELCKEAGMLNSLGHYAPAITGLGILGLGTVNAVNSGEGLSPSYLAMAAMAPLGMWGMKHALNVGGKVRAAGKAEEFLTKGLSPEQIEAGHNVLNMRKNQVIGEKQYLDAHNTYKGLHNKLTSGEALSDAEKAQYQGLHEHFNEQAFNQKYFQQGDWKNKAQGGLIRFKSMFDKNLAKDIKGGAYASQDHLQNLMTSKQQFVDANQNFMQNIEHLKSKNIDPHVFTSKTIASGGDVNKVLNTDFNAFKNIDAVKQSDPNWKQGKISKIKNFLSPQQLSKSSPGEVR